MEQINVVTFKERLNLYQIDVIIIPRSILSIVRVIFQTAFHHNSEILNILHNFLQTQTRSRVPEIQRRTI